MPSADDKIAELQLEIARLMEEVDRYRTAAEDTMQLVDWCVGYFTGARKPEIARGLNANRVQIRRHLLQRTAQSQPVPARESAA